MKLWDILYDENSVIPKVFYQCNIFNMKLEFKLREEIFKIFYLTHRDNKKKIKEIEENFDNEAYRLLYEMVFPPKLVKHQNEYLVDLLNLFSVEINFKGII